MGSSYAMLDMTVYGCQEASEDSPRAAATVLQHHARSVSHRRRRPRRRPPDGRPIPQWSRLAAGRSDDLGTAGVTPSDHHH